MESSRFDEKKYFGNAAPQPETGGTEPLDRGFTPASHEDRKIINDLMREVEEHNGMREVATPSAPTEAELPAADCSCGGSGKHYNFHSAESCGVEPAHKQKKIEELPEVESTESQHKRHIVELRRECIALGLKAIAWRERCESIEANCNALNEKLIASLNECERLKEQAKPDLCEVCCGYPLTSGKQCICGGSGMGYGEKIGLRKAVFEAEARADSLQAAIEEAVKVLRVPSHLSECNFQKQKAISLLQQAAQTGKEVMP